MPCEVTGESYGYCRHCRLKHTRNCLEKLRKQILKAYGNKCNWPKCKITDPDMLHLDHINDDGAVERKKNNNASYFMARRLGFPKDKYQLLCANHNVKKQRMKERNKK
jgi:hypothetical protein